MPDWVSENWAPDDVLTEINIADTAARAARAVPGVVRLQPGVWGLLRQLATQAWERTTGAAVPDIAGVDAQLVDDGHRVQIDVRIVVDIEYQAAAVGRATHDAVVAAVAAVGHPVAVRVHIVEFEFDAETPLARPRGS